VLYAWLLLGQLPSPMQFTAALIIAGVIVVRVAENQRSPRV
jgi:drug/metabolite transporter (DMT)-like permease